MANKKKFAKTLKGPEILPPSLRQPINKNVNQNTHKKTKYITKEYAPKSQTSSEFLPKCVCKPLSDHNPNVIPLTLELAAKRIVYGNSIFDWDDDSSEIEKILRRFDLEILYGPSIGISRLKRYERAKLLGLEPPHEVYEAIKESSDSNSILK